MSIQHIPIVVCDHEECDEAYELGTCEPRPAGWVERPGEWAKRHYCPAHAAEHGRAAGGKKKAKKGTEAP